MGAQASRYRLPPTSPNYQLFSISISSSNKIRVIDADLDVVNVIRENLTKNYGLEGESISSAETLFKLQGHPFRTLSAYEENLSVRYFFALLLEELCKKGWRLCLDSNLKQSVTGIRSTLFFAKAVPASSETRIFCLSFSSTNRIQIFNGTNRAIRALRECVGGKHLNKKENDSGRIFEISIQNEYAFGFMYAVGANESPKLHDAAKVNALLAELFERFSECGFKHYGTVNLKGTTDCIFFIKTRRVFRSEPWNAVVARESRSIAWIYCVSRTNLRVFFSQNESSVDAITSIFVPAFEAPPADRYVGFKHAVFSRRL
ncbi:hypothetical protein L596_027986 [Steinernema carpocapsae]|uniref:Uncharacterized protein n=1 Tax=Steinernema carpocapsae TaxID=34508 RepID=A0A4U5LX65_STECR|nr:hypothetical protein L596_027986 [Steinernema carpocapsae]